MVDLLRGLLGGVRGAGNAVDEIAKEKRAQMAEMLKMQAAEAMQSRMSKQEFQQTGQLQGERIGAEKEMQGTQLKNQRDMQTERIGAERELQGESLKAQRDMQGERISAQQSEGLLSRQHEATMQGGRIKSNEAMNSAAISSREKIAKMEDDFRRQLQTLKEKGGGTGENAAQMIKARTDAFSEARKVLEEDPNNIDLANSILTSANLPSLEQYEVEPEKKGFLGWGSKPAVTGFRQKGSVSLKDQLKKLHESAMRNR